MLCCKFGCGVLLTRCSELRYAGVDPGAIVTKAQLAAVHTALDAAAPGSRSRDRHAHVDSTGCCRSPGTWAGDSTGTGTEVGAEAAGANWAPRVTGALGALLHYAAASGYKWRWQALRLPP